MLKKITGLLRGSAGVPLSPSISLWHSGLSYSAICLFREINGKGGKSFNSILFSGSGPVFNLAKNRKIVFGIN